MSTLIPIYLNSDGGLAQVPNGSILNIGGTSQSNFTVGGRGLLFDDGTSTGGGSSSGTTLQSTYDNSSVANEPAKIMLGDAKDFVIGSADSGSSFFKIDAVTGKVTIFTDVEIKGSSTIIDTVVQDSDHWLISPKAGTTTALKIEPDAGVTLVTDVVTIRVANAAAPVFRINRYGNLILAGDADIAGTLTVGNLVSSQVSAISTKLDAHIAGTADKHDASEINATLNGQATTVQDALDALDSGSGGTSSNTEGFTHMQLDSSTEWVITHNLNTLYCQVTVYDTSWHAFIPDDIQVLNVNMIRIVCGVPSTGSVVIVGVKS